MKNLRFYFICLLATMGHIISLAQIGYQVSLLNTATGEPRANESVVVSVTLSNSAGEAFYSETKTAVTNDFGVLSLSIGNADTFKDVDLTKMPFYIEVTANGVMIGKSQILNVPAAEVAKQLIPIDVNLIVGSWSYNAGPKDDSLTVSFSAKMTGIKTVYYDGGKYSEDYSFTYNIYGNFVIANYGSYSELYYYNGNKLLGCNRYNPNLTR